jgi:hypothetical protein
MLTSPVTRKLRVRPMGLRPAPTGLGDFAHYASNPEFAAAWSKIQAQLTVEGNGPASLAAATAQEEFASVFDNIASQLGVDPSTALDAAQQYIVAGHTVLGAVDTVQKVVSAAQGGDPAGAFNILTGAMVAAATSTGLVTAGVGALITIGVGAALSILQNAGLFGSPPKGTEWCPGLFTSTLPKIQVGCVATNANVVQYGSPYWRRFPKRSGGNTNDALWFAQNGSIPGDFNTIEWAGSPNGPKAYWTSYGGYRLIDSAFPDVHYLAVQNVLSGLSDFADAFTQAWIANKEYALNGLKVQPDWQVLRTLLGIWNRAHDGSTYIDVKPANKATLDEPVYVKQFDGTYKISAPTPSYVPPLYQTVIQDLIANGSQSDPVFQTIYIPSENAVRIHTGPVKVARKVIPLVLGVKGGASPSLTPGQAIALTALGTVAAVGAGGSLYALYTKQGIGTFWGKMVGNVVAGAKGLVGR